MPGGAAPSYAHGYYDRDNAAYRAWDAISRDRETFGRGSADVDGSGRERRHGETTRPTR